MVMKFVVFIVIGVRVRVGGYIYTPFLFLFCMSDETFFINVVTPSHRCPVCGTALSVSPTNCLEAQPSATEKGGGDSLLASSSSSWSFSCSYCMWSGASQGLVAQDKEALIKLLVGNEVGLDAL